MAYSYIRYTGSGSTKNYTFSFPYLDQSNIVVTVGGVVTTDYTFLSASTVAFTTAPASGEFIEIRRVTPKDTPIVNFADGSVLLEKDLDLLVTFNLYVAQEADDGVHEGLFTGVGFHFDADGKRIINVADPVDPQDVATKQWAETALTSSVAASASSASASAITASDSAGTATLKAGEASDSAYTATLKAAEASASETAAAGSADAAASSATDPYLVTVATDLALGGVSGISDYGSITEAVSTVGVGTSYIKLVKDNLVPINSVATNISAVTSAYTNMSAINDAPTHASTATTQAGLATTNGAVQVALATAQVTLATTAASAAAGSESLVNSYKDSAETAKDSAETAKDSAETARDAAETARDAALAAYDSFDDRYLGTYATNPTADNDGDSLIAGSLFWDTAVETLKIYTGSLWVAAYVSGSGFATSTTTISAGSGLQGGGSLATDRVISIATGGVTATHLSSTLDLGTI